MLSDVFFLSQGRKGEGELMLEREREREREQESGQKGWFAGQERKGKERDEYPISRDALTEENVGRRSRASVTVDEDADIG